MPSSPNFLFPEVEIEVVPGLSDGWAFAPFDYHTDGDAIVAVSFSGRELTADEVRKAIARQVDAEALA